MKKLLLLALPFVIIFSSCKERTVSELERERDSLIADKEKSKVEVNEYFRMLNEIANDFDQILIAEQIISIETHKELVDKSAAKRIGENITIMDNALKNSKEKILHLEELIKKGNTRYAELEKRLDYLTKSYESRANMSDSLNKVLDIYAQKLSALDKKVGSLTKENEQKASLLKQQSDELNSGWYAIGSSKELKRKKIVTKGGLFTAKKLDNDFSQEYFIKVDIRYTSSIPVYSKQAKILTNHPLASYSIVDETGGKVIKIKDSTQFWSISKFLVVEIN